MEANVVQDIISKSPLLAHKHVADLVAQSGYDLKEIQFAKGGPVDMLLGINFQASHML